MAERFVKEEVIPQASHYDRTGQFPWPILRKAHGLGLMNVHIGTEYGGLGLGTLNGCLLAERMAYGCTGVVTITEANVLGSMPIAIAGNERQKKKYLTRYSSNLATSSLLELKLDPYLAG